MQIARVLSLGLPLALGPAAVAQVWTEAGDAGRLPATAQVIAAGTGALTTINGNINNPAEPGGAGDDKDMYMIRIDNPSAFSASTVGGSTLDTQLFLFKLDGRGVVFNDDDPVSSTTQSRITNAFVTTAGCYLLAITRYDRDPLAGGQELWLDTPFNTERVPDGPAATSPLDSWSTTASALTGAYVITLTGCSYVPVNGLEIYPGVTSFTSRGNVGTNAGEVMQGFHSSHWGSVGDAGTHVSLAGLTYITQDQNAATQELYDLVVRSGNDTAGPTPGAAGELCVISGLQTPSGTGIAAWLITVDFATPCALPQKDFFSVGMRFPVSGWTADGQSVHATDVSAQQAGSHVQNHSWQILPGPVVSHTGSRSWRFTLRLTTPLLQNGSFATTTATYALGMGGMFPPPTTHGWSTHVRAGPKYAGGFAAPFLATAKLPSGIQLGGIGGSLCITGTLVPLLLVGLDANGAANIPVLDPVPVFGGLSTLYAQAVVVDPTFASIHFTNMNGVTFQ